MIPKPMLDAAINALLLRGCNPHHVKEAAEHVLRDALAAAPSAQAEPPQPDRMAALLGEWQPIETAPREGAFLVWADHGLPWPAHAQFLGDEYDGIYSNAHGRVNDPANPRSLRATHWRPLPPPPTGDTP